VSTIRPGVLLLAGLAACTAANTGYLGGLLTGPGQTRAPVEFVYTVTERTGDRGTLAATLPGGEAFTGSYVQVTHATPTVVLLPIVQVPGFEGAWTDWGPDQPGDVWVAAGDLDLIRRTYAGRIMATLFGNRGNAMRCRFTLFDPPRGFAGGGEGQCQVSYGNGTIAVQF
jgi:hypothetical protein